MSEIDWNVELRKAERAFDGLPPEPTPEELRARRAAELAIRQRNDELGAAAGAWTRLLLVAALASSLSVWPYPRQCGPGLIGYVAASAVVVIGGLWVAACTWRARLARTHVLAMLMTALGIALVLVEVLPRVGYAKPDPARPQRWWCAVAAN